MRNILILILFLVFFILPVNAFSIGTAPGLHYLGEFEPGDMEYIKFYLLTNANGDVLTSLSYTTPHLDLYFPDKFKYISSYETSQEDISDWVVFQQNPVLVSPRKSFIVTLENGEIVKANAEVVYKLTIPKNAEPGYHIGSVSLSPKVVGEGAGTGIATIGLTRYIFVFKIKGDAERKGEIKNIYADRVAEDRARIDIIFQNTGKDTISVWVDELNIYNEYGNISSNLKSGMKYISPGETQILPVYWIGEKVTGGTYNAEAKINYITGYSSKAATIEIPDVISIPTEVSKFEFPWWILLLVVLIIILIIYWKS
jgi:hypothetical protein